MCVCVYKIAYITWQRMLLLEDNLVRPLRGNGMSSNGSHYCRRIQLLLMDTDVYQYENTLELELWTQY